MSHMAESCHIWRSRWYDMPVNETCLTSRASMWIPRSAYGCVLSHIHESWLSLSHGTLHRLYSSKRLGRKSRRPSAGGRWFAVLQKGLWISNLYKNLCLYTDSHDITAPLTDSDGVFRLFKVKPVDLSVGAGQPEDVGQPTNIAESFYPSGSPASWWRQSGTVSQAWVQVICTTKID